MGEAEVVPKKVEKWAYGGDSIAGSGYRGKKSPRNTDIGTRSDTAVTRRTGDGGSGSSWDGQQELL